MKHYIAGKVIIITGASSGFGEAAAYMLNEMGAKLVLTGRTQKTLNAVGKKLLPKTWLALKADATSTKDWSMVVKKTIKTFGRIDVLVCNHGCGIKIANIESMTDEDFQKVLDTNLTSIMKGARAVIPEMRKSGFGHIVNVSSGCAHFAWPSWAVYTAAKTGMVGYTRCLHKEMEVWGGKATCFIPGAARTNFCANAKIDDSWMTGYPTAEDFARTLVHCIDVPENCVIDEVSIWGTKQVKDMLTAY
jgi:NADP-dependent 3-hydroxy acid dehydrogenase YdfG